MGDGSRFELRFIPHNETGVAVVSHAEEMGIVFSIRADGMAARFKAESAVIAGLAKDKEWLAFDLFLPQGISEQFRPHPLPLKVWCDCHGAQVKPADVSAIGIGKDDVGDDPVGMKTDPFMYRSAIFVELLHQFGFEFSKRKGEAEQGIDSEAVINSQFLYFHSGSPRQ